MSAVDSNSVRFWRLNSIAGLKMHMPWLDLPSDPEEAHRRKRILAELVELELREAKVLARAARIKASRVRSDADNSSLTGLAIRGVVLSREQLEAITPLLNFYRQKRRIDAEEMEYEFLIAMQNAGYPLHAAIGATASGGNDKGHFK